MWDAAFCKPHPQLVNDQKTTRIPYKTTGMKGLAIKSIKLMNPGIVVQ